MQCPQCGARFPDQMEIAPCPGCEAERSETASPLCWPESEEASRLPAVQQTGLPENGLEAQSVSLLSQTQENEASMFVPSPPLENERTFQEFGRSEFRGMQVPAPAGVENVCPPAQFAPGESLFRASPPPGIVPTLVPASGRQIPVLLRTLLLVLLLLVLVSGSAFVGLRIGQEYSDATSTKASPIVASSSMPDPDRLYKQVTGEPPLFAMSLQDPASGSWSVTEQPTYGCEIKSDGLHIHIAATGHFGYCASGRGGFGDFAFQVTMTILSGDAGGIIFRDDPETGNMYYWKLLSEGGYRIGLEQQNQATNLIGSNTDDAGVFLRGYHQQYVLTLIAQGSRMYFYINQTFLTMLQNTTSQRGYLGLLADDETLATQVVYTNARIWSSSS